jgi:hypothetical protein
VLHDDPAVHELERVNREQHVGLREPDLDRVWIDHLDARQLSRLAVLDLLCSLQHLQVGEREPALVAGEEDLLEGPLDVLGRELASAVELDALPKEEAEALVVGTGFPSDR